MIKSLIFLCTVVLVSSQQQHAENNILGTEGYFQRLNKHSRQKYLRESNTGTLLQERFVGSAQTPADIRSRAQDALVLLAENENEISSTCANHTEIFIEALMNRETWALQMLDALGKPPSGLLDLNLHWLGNWDECWAVEASVNTSDVITHPFTGKYCTTAFILGEQPSGAVAFGPQALALLLGTCYPSSCSEEDAVGLVQILEGLLPINTTGLPPPVVNCNDLDPSYDDKAIAILIVCSLFLAVVIMATAYDILVVNWSTTGSSSGKSELPTKQAYGSFNGHAATGHHGNGHVVDDRTPLIATENGESGSSYETKVASSVNKENGMKLSNSYTPGLLGRLLLAFSVYTNAPKIFNTRQPAGTLTAVNGIRFISMTWVILGHTYAFGLGVIDNTVRYVPEKEAQLSFQAIGNATFAVDTFFVLSGLLVSYLSLKEMKKRGGMMNFKWGMYYFHRFWRLTPPYMLFLMTYVPLVKYFANGPVWPQKTGFDVDECRDTWWTNLLYINNLVHTDKMCMGWSWYLANDMQFYVLSPLMLIPLYYSPLWGTISCFGLVLVNFISAGVISKHDEAPANFLLGGAGASFEHLYIKPWARIGPYAIGFFTGYLLYKSDCKLNISKTSARVMNTIGWLLATTLALLILYGLWSSDNKPTFGVDVSALYNATSRTVWGACIAWVVYSCAVGYGGWVNKLLSWRAVIPLSRLTYCAYLVHPVIMYTYYYSHRTLQHWYDLEIVYIFCGHLCLSYAAAFIVSLVYESPMMGLEKVLLGREKSS